MACFYKTGSRNVSVEPAGEPFANATQVDSGSVSITLPPNLFNQSSANDSEISILFGMYTSSVLFPLPEDSMLFTDANETYDTFAVASTLVSATIVGFENRTFSDMGVEFEVTIVLKLDSEVLKHVIC